MYIYEEGFGSNISLPNCKILQNILYFDICALSGYYAEYGSNSLLTFRDNLSVPYSSV